MLNRGSNVLKAPQSHRVYTPHKLNLEITVVSAY